MMKSQQQGRNAANRELFQKKGTSLWVPHPVECFVRASVEEPGEGNTIRVKTEIGENLVVDIDLCDLCTTTPQQVAKIDDLTKLPALNEPSLLSTLHERFKLDSIYTYTGPILLAVNPFKRLPLYTDQILNTFIRCSGDPEAFSKLDPHPYAIAARAFASMLQNEGRNQSVLVSGESGAGKTETTKIVLKYLTTVSDRAAANASGGTKKEISIADRVLQANPLMEAFGNAKTTRNDNSSRFGKMILMHFSSQTFELIGSSTATYLLEKGRVIHQASGERNYHIFYELAEGLSSDEKRRLLLDDIETYSYSNQSKTYTRADVEDREQFQATLNAMDVVGITEEEREFIFRVVIAVLHLGNVRFSDAGKEGSKISSESRYAAESASKLLGVDADELNKALTTRKISVGIGANTIAQGFTNALGLSESYLKELTPEQAAEGRDALAMTLYERLFGWIVWRINSAIAEMAGTPVANNTRNANRRRAGSHDGNDMESNFRSEHTIGCLDIFGFEVFKINSFEQLCINYANESLQQQFNEYVFELEQRVYKGEGIDWNFIEFPDNKACLEMIEARPIGLLSLIDEECLMPKGGDKSLANKLYQNLPKRYNRFDANRKEQVNLQFTIRHFAGDVCYNVEGFYHKNKNELHQELVDILVSSSEYRIATLLPSSAADAAGDSGGAAAAAHFDKVAKKRAGGGGHHHQKTMDPQAQQAASKIQQKTVGANFKQQLGLAMQRIRASQPHYIRCLKPNDQNVCAKLTRVRLMEQLRYSGVLEVVKVARAGYPTRFALADFALRFAVLAIGHGHHSGRLSTTSRKSAASIGMHQAHGATSNVKTMLENNDVAGLKDICEEIMIGADLTFGDDYQIGLTRVFLRPEAYTRIEILKGERVRKYVIMIQKTYRGYGARRKYRVKLNAHSKIQATFRGFRVRKQYRQMLLEHRAAIACQKIIRGYLTTRKYDPIFENRAHAALVIIRSIRLNIMKKRLKRISDAAKRGKAAVLVQSLARVVKAQKKANELYVNKVTGIAATSIQSFARMLVAKKKKDDIYERKLKEKFPTGTQFIWYLLPLIIVFLLANPAILITLVLLAVSMAIGGGAVLEQQKRDQELQGQRALLAKHKLRFGTQADQRKKRTETLENIHSKYGSTRGSNLSASAFDTHDYERPEPTVTSHRTNGSAKTPAFKSKSRR